MKWFIVEKGAKLGPFKPNEVLTKLRQGDLSLDSMVMREGSSIRRRLVDVLENLSDEPTPGTGVAPPSRVDDERTRVAFVPSSAPEPELDKSFDDAGEKTAVSQVMSDLDVSMKFEVGSALLADENSADSRRVWAGSAVKDSDPGQAEPDKEPAFDNKTSGASFSLSLSHKETPKKKAQPAQPVKPSSPAIPEPLVVPGRDDFAPFSLNFAAADGKPKGEHAARAKGEGKKESEPRKDKGSSEKQSGEAAREKRRGESAPEAKRGEERTGRAQSPQAEEKNGEGATVLLELEGQSAQPKGVTEGVAGTSLAQKKDRSKSKPTISPRVENSVVALDLLAVPDAMSKIAGAASPGKGRRSGSSSGRHGNDRAQRKHEQERQRERKSRSVMSDLASVALISAGVMALIAVLSFFLLGNPRVRAKLGLDSPGYEIGQPITTAEEPLSRPPVVVPPKQVATPEVFSHPEPAPAPKATANRREEIHKRSRNQSFSAKPLPRATPAPAKRQMKAEIAKSSSRGVAARDIPNGWPRSVVRKGSELSAQAGQVFTLQNVSVRALPTGCAPCRVSGVLTDGSRVLLVSPGSKQWSALGSRSGDLNVQVKGKILRRNGSETWILVQGIAQ